MGSTKETTYRLNLDAKGFQGVARETKAQWDSLVQGLAVGAGRFGELAAAAGPAGLAVAALGGAAVTAGAALTKFLFDAAKGAVDLGGRLSDMSAKTGQGVESLQAFGAAARLVGGSTESASAAVVLLQRRLATAPAEFQKLGLSVDQLRNAAPDQLLLAVSNRLRDLPEGFQRTSAAMAILGQGAAEHLPLLSSDLEGAAQRAKDLGQVLSADAVKALDDLGDEITVAGDTWEGFKNQLGAALAQNPAVVQGVRDITTAIGALATTIKEHQGEIDTFVTALGNLSGIHIGEGLDQLGTLLTKGGPNARRSGSATERDFRDGVTTPGGMDAGSLAILRDALRVTKEQTDADKRAADAARKRVEEIKRLANSMTKVAAQQEMTKLSVAIEVAGRQGGIAAEKLEEVRQKVQALMRAGADASPIVKQLGLDVRNLTAEGVKSRNLGDLGAFAPGLQGKAAPKAGPLFDANVDLLEETAERTDQARYNTVAWADALRDVGGLISGIASGVAGLPGLFLAAAGGAASVMGALKAHAAMLDDNERQGLGRKLTKDQKIAAGANAAGTAVSIWQDNKYNRSAAGGFASGAGRGAAAGAAFGPYGMVVGAVVGGIIGALSGSAFRKAAKEAGKTLGGAVSDELAKAIMATSKKYKISTKDASLLHLTDFMAETGKSATEVGPQVKGLFDAIISGSVPAKLGMEQLNTVFDELATAAGRGDVAAQKMTGDLLQQGIAAGKLTDSMQSFVHAQLGAMAGGASKILEGVAMIGKDVPLGDFGTAAAQSFVAGFTAAIGEKGLAGAIEESGSGITDFYQRLMDEGNTAAAAMLAPWVQLEGVINDDDTSVKGFLTTLQGMSEVFGGLDAMGFATAGAFQGLETGIQGTVNALDQAGISGPAALQAIAPQLAQVVAAHEKYGFVIDDATQKLIDEAGAAGIAFPTDPILQMVDALNDLIVTLGGVPRDLSVTTHYKTTGTPPAGGGPIPETPEPIGAARGYGPMIAPNLGGGLGPLIQTHAGEGILIMPRAKVKARGLFHAARGYGDEFEPRIGSGGSTGTSTGTYTGGSISTTEAALSTTAAVAAAIEPIAEGIRRQAGALNELSASVADLSSRPAANLQIIEAPTSVDTTGLARNNREDFLDEIEQVHAQKIRNKRSEIARALEDAGFQVR